jgi:multisubunit Na+/H+ antiporter MnhB subunit
MKPLAPDVVENPYQSPLAGDPQDELAPARHSRRELAAYGAMAGGMIGSTAGAAVMVLMLIVHEALEVIHTRTIQPYLLNLDHTVPLLAMVGLVGGLIGGLSGVMLGIITGPLSVNRRFLPISGGLWTIAGIAWYGLFLGVCFANVGTVEIELMLNSLLIPLASALAGWRFCRVLARVAEPRDA